MAEAGGGGVDQPRILAVQHIPAEAELFHRARPVVFDEHIGMRQELGEDRLVVGVLQVERDGFLAAVQRAEIGRGAVEERPIGAAVVAGAGLLDLDHPRARHRQQEAGIGAVVDMPQVEHGDAVEGVGTPGHYLSSFQFDCGAAGRARL